MLQPYVTPVPLAAIILVHCATLFALVRVLQSPRPDFPGWRVVGPSGMHWFCFLGSWGLSALISWVWLFVGSARRDAETQMLWALGLLLVFGLSAAWAGLHAAKLRRTALRWRGGTLRWNAGATSHEASMANFDAARRALSGALILRFKHGVQLQVDFQARNATAMLAAISERLGRDAY